VINCELLDMLSSINNAGLRNNIKNEIINAEYNVNALLEEVENLKSDVKQYESLLKTAKEKYNNNLELANAQKQDVDSSYQNYLTRKEVYFYANNIYLAGDNLSSGKDIYKKQILNYTSKKSFNQEIFNALKDIKMQEGVVQDSPELQNLQLNIEKNNQDLNDAEEVLILLKILYNHLENITHDPETDPAFLESFSMKSDSFYLKLRNVLSEIRLLSDETIEKYISKLDTFILKNGMEIFSDSDEPIEMMVIDMQSYGEKIKSKRQTLINNARKKYNKYLERFINEKLLPHAHYKAKLEEYKMELELVEKQMHYLKTELKIEDAIKVDEYIEKYSGKWEGFETESMDEEIINVLLFEKRKWELLELIALYSYLSGEPVSEVLQNDSEAFKSISSSIQPASDTQQNEKENEWWKNLENLKQKYGVNENEVVKYEQVIDEGLSLVAFDFSEAGCIKIELIRKKELLERVLPLDYFNSIAGNNLFSSILGDFKKLYISSLLSRTELERYSFDLQVKSFIEEKSRFE